MLHSEHIDLKIAATPKGVVNESDSVAVVDVSLRAGALKNDWSHHDVRRRRTLLGYVASSPGG